MNNNTDAAAVSRRRMAVAAAILAGLAVPGAVLGQQPESVTVDVGACVNLESPGERLDCYEEQVKRARAQAPLPSPAPAATAPPARAAPAAAPPAAPPPAAAPPASPSAPAGERQVRVENARVPNGGSSDELKLEGTIAALRETVPNAWVITLDNGEVWRQDFPTAFGLRVGQRVQITQERRFRGYRLTVVGMNGFIQVEPVR
jgi:hypothetical protein